MKDYKPFFDLSNDKIHKLLAIPVNDLVVTFKNAFEDDHLPCVNVVINRIRVSFWWLDHEVVAAFKYANESNRAKKVVHDLIKRSADIELSERQSN